MNKLWNFRNLHKRNWMKLINQQLFQRVLIMRKSILCIIQYMKGIIPNKSKTKKQKLFENGQSYCPSCKKVKDIGCFNKDSRTVYGITIYCKECFKIDYKKNIIRNTDNYLKYEYNITLDEYNNLLKK